LQSIGATRESKMLRIMNWLRGGGSNRQRCCRPMVETLESRTLMSTTPAAILLVPAYFYPVAGGGWDQMAAAAKSAPVTAILNPDSGPGSSADPAYAAAINKLLDHDGHVVAYIHTSYGQRSLAIVKAEVRAYASFYQLDGFFVDEMATDAADIPYYQHLYAYIKKINRHYEVIGNPGTSTQRSYLTAPTADVLVDFEDNQSAYPSAAPPSWVRKFRAQQFGNIVGEAASVSAMEADLLLAHERNAGYVYVTDQNINDDNTAYDRLPAYWSQEVADIKAENG